MTKYNPTQRKGVTLLVVLALMTMFAMLVITFMMITAQARRTSESLAWHLLKDENTGDRGYSVLSAEFDAAIEKLIIGDKLESVIGPHSILENLYGNPEYNNGANDDLKGNSSAAQHPTGIYSNSRLVELTTPDLTNVPNKDLLGSIISFQNTTTGITKTTHIIDAAANIIAPFDDMTDAASITFINGATCYVNTPVFGGTGPDIKSSPGTGAYLEKTVLYPNILASNNVISDGTIYLDYLKANLVLMNPDYTAPDYRTMFLAYNEFDNTGKIKRVIPSFLRPFIYDTITLSGNDDYRKATLRPLPFDHPKFTGSNPTATPASYTTFLQNGPWDVDNDGDGIADGIWLDAALGTVTDPKTGKTYKKLVSYYVLDMDGRININTAGNIAITHAITHNNESDSTPFDPNLTPLESVLGSDAMGGTTLRGISSGASSIRLDKAGISNIEQLFQGITTPNIEGRYGDSTDPYSQGIAPATDAELLQLVKERNGINGDAFNFGNNQADFWGNFALEFDPLGNRYYSLLPTATRLALNPYLFNPYKDVKENGDIPFQSADLERVLRTFNDADFVSYNNDASQRIRKLLGETFPQTPTTITNSDWRHSLTTRSSDIPAPSRLTRGGSLFETLKDIAGSNYNTAEEFFVNLPEILAGRGIDPNRFSLPPYDNMSPQDLLKHKIRFARSLFYLVMTLRYNELCDTSSTYTEGSLTRQEAIKRVAQWAVNVVDFCDNDAIMTPLVYSKNPFTSIVAANYLGDANSVSAVDDFFNGTAVPDSTTTDYGVVWGMEQPEIAITETFAVHNRRVADSIKESAIGNTPTPCTVPGCTIDKNRCVPTTTTCTGTHDTDFDQVLIPEGSLFVELYRQGNPQRTYPTIAQGGLADAAVNTKINLAERVNTNGSYIWRLAISEKNNYDVSSKWGKSGVNDMLDKAESDTTGTYSFQPKDQFPGDNKGLDSTGVSVERIVWFGNAMPDKNWEDYSYLQVGTGTDIQLEPNSYLIVAPRLYTSFQSTATSGAASFGTAKTNQKLKIDLRPTMMINALGQDVGLDINFKHKTPTIMIAEMPKPDIWTTIPATQRIGLSASEPLRNNYYPEPDGIVTVVGDSLKKAYTPTTLAALISPLDKDELKAYGTIPCYKTIMLQRLADPTRQWDAVNNPYLTVDWNMIDLHVINSEKDSVSTITAADEPGITAETLYFTSRQWGYTGGLIKNRPNLWTRHIDENASGGEPDYAGLKTATKIANDDDDNKFDELTLGYLNKFVTATNTVPAGSNLNAAVYKGMPSGNAFMYFPWYDTPLNNSYELMLVPTCSPGRFGVEFDDSEKTADDPTEGWATKGTSLGGQYAKFRDPKSDVGMYFNYFDSGTNSLNLADLFEWIRVPSKFAGSVKWTKDASGNLCPYYTGQEPGKINLNTANEAAWSALQGNTSNLRSYADLQQKRSKLSATGDPENFLTPFRSPGAVNFVPDGLDVQKQNQATLFGEEGIYTTAPPTTPKLFVDIVAGSDANANWLAALQPMLQLADMTTTRSNVFAVWVTIGYFEATPSTDTNIPVSSDGNRYELGVEKGIDNGTVKRHRAFYLLDRSIPVGFRRGEVFKDKDDKPQYRDIILKETILE